MAMADYPCSVTECNKQAHAGGFCLTHWRRFKATGSTEKPVKPKASDFQCSVGRGMISRIKRRIAWTHI